MFTTVLILYIIVCVALVLVILSQASKGGALEGMLGGTASSMMGAHEASTFLKRWTRYLGIAFFALSLLLAFIVQRQHSDQGPKSAIEKLQSGEIQTEEEATTDKPALPNQMQVNPGAQPIQVKPSVQPQAQPEVQVKPTAVPQPKEQAKPEQKPAAQPKPAAGNE